MKLLRIQFSLRMMMVAIAVISVAILFPCYQYYRIHLFDDAIREIVIRDQFAAKLGRGGPGQIYFLEFDGESDPSDHFLTRLADLKATFRKGSRAIKPYNSLPLRSRVTDSITGKIGTVMTITIKRRIHDDEFEVEVSYYQGPLAGSGETYTYRKIKGVWMETSTSESWVS